MKPLIVPVACSAWSSRRPPGRTSPSTLARLVTEMGQEFLTQRQLALASHGERSTEGRLMPGSKNGPPQCRNTASVVRDFRLTSSGFHRLEWIDGWILHPSQSASNRAKPGGIRRSPLLQLPYPLGLACCQAQPSRHISSRLRWVLQPSLDAAKVGSAKEQAASPARRFTS